MGFSNLVEETRGAASPARLTVRSRRTLPTSRRSWRSSGRPVSRPSSAGRRRRSTARCCPRPASPTASASARTAEALAFAIVSGLGDPHGDLYLKRIAVVRPGEGIGTAFLARVLDEAFDALGAWRFHLDCFADNLRAQRAYAKLGFSRDGVLRQAYRMPDGTRADLVLMALLKPEWAARGRRGDVTRPRQGSL